ncbi:MAG: hypothetical protein ACXVP4_10865 [Bacteroidia bacterium]
MKKFDFAIQTLLLTVAVVSAIGVLLVDEGFLVLTLFVQFLTGCWQLISAFAAAANNNHGNIHRTKAIRIFWIAVIIYFVVLALLFYVGIEILMISWFFSAWLIAIYYYVFTIKLVFGKYKERKTYLDIAN